MRNFIETSDLPNQNKEKAKKVLESAQKSIEWTQQFEKEVISFYELEDTGSSSLPVEVEVLILILPSLLLLFQNIF